MQGCGNSLPQRRTSTETIFVESAVFAASCENPLNIRSENRKPPSEWESGVWEIFLLLLVVFAIVSSFAVVAGCDGDLRKLAAAAAVLHVVMLAGANVA